MSINFSRKEFIELRKHFNKKGIPCEHAGAKGTIGFRKKQVKPSLLFIYLKHGQELKVESLARFKVQPRNVYLSAEGAVCVSLEKVESD